MSTLAAHRYLKAIGPGKNGTGSHTNAPLSYVADKMQPDYAIHTLHHARLDHWLCPADALLRWLENKLDVACQIRAPLAQNIGHRQQDRRMPIVSTSMHLAINLRTIINLVQFMN